MELLSQKVAELVEELLLEGILDEHQVALAQARVEKLKTERLDEAIIELGFVAEKDLTSRLGRKLGIANISLANYKPDASALKNITADQAARWKIIPLFKIEGTLTVATADPLDLENLDDARRQLGMQIECILTSKSDLHKAIKTFYGEAISAASTKNGKEVVHYGIEGRRDTELAVDNKEMEILAVETVRMVDKLIHKAYTSRASDIHLEPQREGMKVRIRVDGMLEHIEDISTSARNAILSRIKIIGGMDVAEHRIPQDGRTHLKIKGKELDMRIATYPTIFGEAAAIRLLSKEQLISLEGLGLLERDLKALLSIVGRPHGIFLVTGPTGSGKTTTLYAALQKVDRDKNHVLSVEDPVENEIEGVSQTQINIKAGVTFAASLRAALREDPDIIMVGEIRDQETANIAFRAALTGHLVLSTLHTNSAIGSIARLKDLGIEPYLISSTLLGVLGQRLVRKVCQACKVKELIDPVVLKRLGLAGHGLTRSYVGKGCKECSMRGFVGRLGLYELMTMEDEMRILINSGAPEVRIKEKSASLGFHTMLEDGVEKVKLGLTTPEEVLRVCAQDDNGSI